MQGDRDAIARAAALLAKAERPLLIGGGGVIDSDAAGDAVKLAEHLDMALIPSYGHSDSLPNSHPLFIGMPGWRGSPEAHDAIHHADVVLALGSRLSERAATVRPRRAVSATVPAAPSVRFDDSASSNATFLVDAQLDGVVVPAVYKPRRGERPLWDFPHGTLCEREVAACVLSDALGWDACDIVLVTGDAYVDHPSFGMAIIGRLLESQGFRVGIIAQPDWQSAEPFKALGKPRVFFGVTGGNMDSMVNRYTADRRLRHDDAYTPNGEGGKRPDRCTLVYAQRCREAYKDVPIILGGIEASLRRIAHYDYWSDKVRRSILLDAKGDLLLYGNAERALVEVSHRIAKGGIKQDFSDIRGLTFLRDATPEGFVEYPADYLDAPDEGRQRKIAQIQRDQTKATAP